MSVAPTAHYWLEAGTKATITLAPVEGGGEGFTVRLATTRPVGSELTRRVYCVDALVAARRVVWLMDQVPGDWAPITEGMPS